MTCQVCRTGNSQYPHTCYPIRPPKANLEVDELLIEMNSDKDDSATCGGSPCVKCTSITCSQCPFFSKEGYTLGDLRAKYTPYIDPKPQQPHSKPPAESPECAEEVPSSTKETQHVEGVKHPDYYMLIDGIEAIDVIARSMTVEAFHGFCFGNILKYRLRAGKKSELATLEKDLKKAEFYQKLFDEHKDKCHAR